MSDLEVPSAYAERMRTARVRHRCCECGGVIEPGERYKYASGVWDGEASSFHLCTDCESLRHGHPQQDEIGIGYLIEYIRESEDADRCQRMIEICDRRASWRIAGILRRALELWREEELPNAH